MYRYANSQWLWFRTGFMLGFDGQEPNPDAKPDPNDPQGCDLAFRHGLDAGRAYRKMYCAHP